ncbi:MAG: hypothetical protein QW165_04445 [Candidatus Woesearchaeota archaeon]
MVDYPQPVQIIKHRGFFNYSDFLQAVRKWFVDEDFDVLDMPMYKQKFPGPTGTEHEFKMRGEKKVTEYVKYKIDFFVRVYNMRDVEIIQDGKKLRVQDGQVQIEITPVLELDWQKRFKGPPPWKDFLNALDKFYRNYIIKYTIVDYWEDNCLLKALQLCKIIRQVLGQEVM